MERHKYLKMCSEEEMDAYKMGEEHATEKVAKEMYPNIESLQSQLTEANKTISELKTYIIDEGHHINCETRRYSGITRCNCCYWYPLSLLTPPTDTSKGDE